MSYLTKQYLPTTKPNTFIKVTMHFNYDTYHWATSTQKPKGYSVTCTPVEKGEFTESFGAFTGFYEIILPCERKSKKRQEQAEKLLEERIETYKD